MSPDARLRAALRLQLAPLSPPQRAELLRACGGLEGLAGGAAPSREARPASLRALESVTTDIIDAELEACTAAGARIVTCDDPSWPPLLPEIHDPPAALWICGELPDPSSIALSIVGARRASPYGLGVARTLARELAEIGCVLVSGGARGVDSAVHLAALAAGVPTVAVLGCGVDVAYPPCNRALFARIADAGAVVSEHPCGTPPLPFHFPVRNRLLAGWSRGVVVVEATLKSGSLITARLAIEQGRDVFAVPGPITSPLSVGTNALIVEGARLMRSPEDVVAELRPEERLQVVRRSREPGPDGPGTRDRILDALPGGDVRGVEELADATGLGVGAVMARLIALEAAGHVQSLVGGLWMRTEARRA